MTDFLLGIYLLGYFVAVAYVFFTERGSGYSIGVQAGMVGLLWPVLVAALIYTWVRESNRRGDHGH